MLFVLSAMDEETKKKVLNAQRNEITEYHIYAKLASRHKNNHNKKILAHISDDELKHYKFWKKHSHVDVKPKMFLVWWYYFISKIFGLTFGLRLMEKGERLAQGKYNKLAESIPEVEKLEKDEREHENALIALLQEEKLKYVGSIVLGLNDALVELTGALAGFTLALQNTRLIAVTGLIMGVAASLSMAASEFLSNRADGGEGKNAAKSSFYTGLTYVFTVIVLILPYFLFNNVYVALTATLSCALMIILIFTFYLSVAKELPFWKRFGEMALISLGVAAISFGIGFLVRMFLGVEV